MSSRRHEDRLDGKRGLGPSLLVAALAFFGSISIHGPIYIGLGYLDELLPASSHQRPPPATYEVDFSTEDSDEPAIPVEDEESSEAEVAVEEEPAARERPRRRPEPEPAREPEPEPEPEVEAQPEPEAEEEPEEEVPVPPTPPPPPPPEDPTNRTSVLQRSQDPDVEPPPDSQYLAEENSRVEEETVAAAQSDTSEVLEAPPEETEGDAEEDEIADSQDSEGDESPHEAPPTRHAQASSRSPRPAAAEPEVEGERGQGGEGSGGRPAEGGGVPEEPTEIVVTDESGSFRIPVSPDRPEGSGEGSGGGPERAATGDGPRRGQGRGSRGQGAGGRPALRMGWSEFEAIYGEEELERQREAYIAQIRGSSRGEARQRRWQRFLAATRDVPDVRPGNQTALNAAASPFAAYLARIHQPIHRRFAEGYLRAVPEDVEMTFRQNPNMHTKLEIAISPDGTIDRIVVVATSGNILFDLGAYEAVMGSQPFPPTPEAIRSPDGRAFFHWSFYRNHRQCGTFNAESFMLSGPGQSTRDRPSADAPAPPDRPIPAEELFGSEAAARPGGRGSGERPPPREPRTREDRAAEAILRARE